MDCISSIIILLSFGDLLGGADIEFEEDHITIECQVFLTLLSVESSRFEVSFVAIVLEPIFVSHDLGANETFLEISVDNTSCLRSFGAISESPALDLVGSSCEEMDELQVLVTRLNDSIDH